MAGRTGDPATRTIDRRIFAVVALGLALGFGFGYGTEASYETKIDGEFEGCEHDQMSALLNGLILICE